MTHLRHHDGIAFRFLQRRGTFCALMGRAAISL